MKGTIMDSKLEEGILFDNELSSEIKDLFYYVDHDPVSNKKRIFFDNAGGSLRLRKANDSFKNYDELPDCPEHSNHTARYLNDVQEEATENIFTMLNAENGSLITSLTASMVMFDITRSVISNIPGTNVVTTALEHPSLFDSVQTFAEENNKEVRTAMPNTKTGSIDTESITKLIDKNTSVLCIIYASNISGSVLDLKSIITEARKIKPDLYIICDAVQHMPHDWVDLQDTPVDAINFAPYKFFGPRGIGIGYVSERASRLKHNKLLGKDENVWELGSPAPGHFGAISEIFNYVCFIGSKFISGGSKRELYVEGMNRINAHERALMNAALKGTDNFKGLRELENVDVYLDDCRLSEKDFVLPISFKNMSCQEAVAEYEKRGIIVFERLITSLYSKRMLEALEIPSIIRVSPLHCYTKEDIETFLKVTAEIAEI